MSCSQTLNGILRDCAANAGGIKAVYIANIDDVSSITLNTAGDKITAISMVSSAKYKGFYFKPGQASFTSDPQFNEAGEYAGEDGVLSMSFGRMDTTKRAQMAALSVGELSVIYQDNNGIYWLLGYDHPVLRNGGQSTPGAAISDFNHYAIDLHSSDHQLAFEVDASAAAGVID